MTLKTVPLILLTLVFTPSRLAAPTPVPQDASMNSDMETGSSTPVDSNVTPSEPDTPSTVTMFFTPAVFLSDYYSPPPAPTQDNSVLLMPEGADIYAEPTDTYDDLAPEESPVVTPNPTTISDEALPTVPTPDPTSAVSEDVRATGVNIPSTTQFTSPTFTAEFSTTFRDSFTHPATRSHSSPTKTSTSTGTVHPTQGHSAHSRTTDQSRKAALIGTILALACISALVACAFCMGCHLPPRLRRKSASVEDGNDSTEDRGKLSTANDKSNTSMQGPASTPDIVVVPVLDSDSPSQPSNPSAAPPPSCASSWQPQQHQTQYEAGLDDVGPFEDVTHILSETTFQGDVESMDSQGSSGYRTSNGAASVTAESYATCESRYSAQSGRASQGSECQADQSSSFLSMSPPESPALQTPKQPQYYVVTPGRSRSKTLTQPNSTLLDTSISSSKSLPARYSNQPGYDPNRMSASVFEDSEWDIAEAYSARLSKGSAVNSSGVGQVMSPISEHMETVEFGGRNCVLVQGLAI